MSKRLTFLSAAALSISMALPVMAQDIPKAEDVVATVNGAEITLGHVLQIRQGLPPQYQQLPPEQLLPGILNQVIQQTLLEQSLDGKLPKSAQYELDNQRRAAMANAAIDDVLKSAVTDEALQAEYDASYADFEATPEYSAAHILVETEDAAQKLAEEARDGADFAELAKTHSTGPSAPNGGSLGWFGPGMMVPPFEDAVVAMEAGEVSDPVETQFGWHVIKLIETRNAPKPSFDEVRPQLEGNLQEKTITALLEDLTAKASIDRTAADALDPGVLSDPSILEE
ncbi:putative parvulin-type peptidyl-prolyl cis-trans isomerase precursor [Thalassovita gelatinovora]|uniref:Parvulin-like PPIase n=1 Tax=Thalassovita gelatinovora TaxID=53501 RepID=A0A0P1FAQ3_THAGE|nr:peptidylprolyl isomerase [Thalassovita gelatinovora]QIZ81099.1 peptidylprolyl isomerase [Thalassovita gelatinovora]CUH64909.1 putative parvulin-type peptidyl-prolyl cis-trans isomerase precursor [Thalassovita gelatinovora]SEP89825.1 peptidyl-prolyl cis-trans isomerase C [Thalassovita gelatinovora]